MYVTKNDAFQELKIVKLTLETNYNDNGFYTFASDSGFLILDKS